MTATSIRPDIAIMVNWCKKKINYLSQSSDYYMIHSLNIATMVDRCKRINYLNPVTATLLFTSKTLKKITDPPTPTHFFFYKPVHKKGNLHRSINYLFTNLHLLPLAQCANSKITIPPPPPGVFILKTQT